MPIKVWQKIALTHIKIISIITIMSFLVTSCSISGCKFRISNIFHPRKQIVTYEPSVEAVKQFDLQKSIENGQSEIIEAILSDHPELLDACFSDGRTPLSYAAMYDQSKIVILLIKRGADINKKSFITGTTPLHEAAQWASLDVVQELILNGAQQGAKDNYGLSPYDYAIKSGKIDIAHVLSGEKP